jgi:hypothetical protein
MKRKRKKSVPILLFWSKRDQRRFIDAVEKFCGLVNDMERIMAPRKRKKLLTAPGLTQPELLAAHRAVNNVLAQK